jgi:anti-anti-sigma factor
MAQSILPHPPLVSDAHVRSDDEFVTVVLRGEHDLDTVEALSSELARVIARRATIALEVDLSGVRFMDASTLGVLVRASLFLRARGCSLTVRSFSPCAQRLFDICGLGDLVDPVAPTRPRRTDAVAVSAATIGSR